MTWLDFVVLALAASQVADTWLYPGGILEGFRDTISAWGALPSGEGVSQPRPTGREVFRWRVAQLANCRFCLLHHVPVILIVMFILPGLIWLGPYGQMLLKLPIYALAATRLSLLLQQISGAKQHGGPADQ